MADNIVTGTFAGTPVTVSTTEEDDVHTPHHRDPEAISQLQLINNHVDGIEGLLGDLKGYVDGLEALSTTLNGLVTTQGGYLDGVEALLTTANGLITTQAGYLDTLEALLAKVGTRKYGTTVIVAVGEDTEQSSAITATEVMLQTDVRCHVKAGSSPVADDTCMPLEAGDRFTMQITSGDKIAVIRDTADGTLWISPVVP